MLLEECVVQHGVLLGQRGHEGVLRERGGARFVLVICALDLFGEVLDVRW